MSNGIPIHGPFPSMAAPMAAVPSVPKAAKSDGSLSTAVLANMLNTVSIQDIVKDIEGVDAKHIEQLNNTHVSKIVGVLNKACTDARLEYNRLEYDIRELEAELKLLQEQHAHKLKDFKIGSVQLLEQKDYERWTGLEKEVDGLKDFIKHGGDFAALVGLEKCIKEKLKQTIQDKRDACNKLDALVQEKQVEEIKLQKKLEFYRKNIADSKEERKKERKKKKKERFDVLQQKQVDSSPADAIAAPDASKESDFKPFTKEEVAKKLLQLPANNIPEVFQQAKEFLQKIMQEANVYLASADSKDNKSDLGVRGWHKGNRQLLNNLKLHWPEFAEVMQNLSAQILKKNEIGLQKNDIQEKITEAQNAIDGLLKKYPVVKQAQAVATTVVSSAPDGSAAASSTQTLAVPVEKDSPALIPPPAGAATSSASSSNSSVSSASGMNPSLPDPARASHFFPLEVTVTYPSRGLGATDFEWRAALEKSNNIMSLSEYWEMLKKAAKDPRSVELREIERQTAIHGGAERLSDDKKTPLYIIIEAGGYDLAADFFNVYKLLNFAGFNIRCLPETKNETALELLCRKAVWDIGASRFCSQILAEIKKPPYSEGYACMVAPGDIAASVVSFMEAMDLILTLLRLFGNQGGGLKVLFSPDDKLVAEVVEGMKPLLLDSLVKTEPHINFLQEVKIDRGVGTRRFTAFLNEFCEAIKSCSKQQNANSAAKVLSDFQNKYQSLFNVHNSFSKKMSLATANGVVFPKGGGGVKRAFDELMANRIKKPTGALPVGANTPAAVKNDKGAEKTSPAEIGKEVALASSASSGSAAVGASTGFAGLNRRQKRERSRAEEDAKTATLGRILADEILQLSELAPITGFLSKAAEAFCSSAPGGAQKHPDAASYSALRAMSATASTGAAASTAASSSSASSASAVAAPLAGRPAVSLTR